MEITTPQGTLTGESIETIIAKHGVDCLKGADLHYADLHGVNLCGIDLTGANLTGSNGVSRPTTTTETPTANSGVNETSKPDDMTPTDQDKD